MEAEEGATETKIRRVRDKEEEECKTKRIKDIKKYWNFPKSTEREAINLGPLWATAKVDL